MIRDPSDGSVRDNSKVDQEAVLDSAAAPKPLASEGILTSTTSGLPAGSTKPENIARLEKSREWLKEYHAKRLACAPANASPAGSID